MDYMLNTIPSSPCIVLFEDLDRVEVTNKTTNESKKNNLVVDKAKCNLSTLLNYLDGIKWSNGHIIIMTTNHKE